MICLTKNRNGWRDSGPARRISKVGPYWELECYFGDYRSESTLIIPLRETKLILILVWKISTIKVPLITLYSERRE